MGDLRNKARKEEQKRRQEELLRKHYPPSPPPSGFYPRCGGCGLTVYETKIYGCGPDGYFCLACMPWKWKREFVASLARIRQPYDPAEHGEEQEGLDHG